MSTGVDLIINSGYHKFLQYFRNIKVARTRVPGFLTSNVTVLSLVTDSCLECELQSIKVIFSVQTDMQKFTIKT